MRAARRRRKIVHGLLLFVLAGGCSSETGPLSTNHVSDSKSAADSSEESLDEVLKVGMTVDEVTHILQMEGFEATWGGTDWTLFKGPGNRTLTITVGVRFDANGAGTPVLKRWHIKEPLVAAESPDRH